MFFWYLSRFNLMVIPNFNIANYAYNSTPYPLKKKLKKILLNLEEIDILLKLFTENYLKANPEKYHVILSINHR